MIHRLLILSIFTILIGIFSGIAFSLGDGFSESLFQSSLVYFLIGVGAIIYNLIQYKKIGLKENVLTIGYLFKPSEQYSMNRLEEWQERRYYLRGKLQRTLLLFFSSNQRVNITNKDFRKEFEKIALKLKSNYDLLDTSPDRRLEISRILSFPVHQVFNAWNNPKLLANWWTPDEAVATFHQFEFQNNGAWNFTLHAKGGKTDFSFQFVNIKVNELVSWKDVNSPTTMYNFKIHASEPAKSKVSYEVVFSSIDECQKLKSSATKSITATITRLEEELQRPQNWALR